MPKVQPNPLVMMPVSLSRRRLPTFKSSSFYLFIYFWKDNPSLCLYVEQLPFKGFMIFYSSMVFILPNGLFRKFYATCPYYLVFLRDWL